MSLIAFMVAAVVLAITPGPGIAYVVARTIAGGRREGLASCLGTGIGGLLHVVAAALGLSLVVAQSAVAFNLVKYLGAAYLVYLGLRLLLRKDQALTFETVASEGARRALFEGVVVEALNVKTALLSRVPASVRLAERTPGTSTGAAREHLRSPQHARRRHRGLWGQSLARVGRRPRRTRATPHPSVRRHHAGVGYLLGAGAA